MQVTRTDDDRVVSLDKQRSIRSMSRLGNARIQCELRALPSMDSNFLWPHLFVWIVLLIFDWNSRSVKGQDINDVRDLYFSGKYDQCIDICRKQVESGIWNDFWSRLLIENLLVVGRYAEAKEVYEEVAPKFGYSVALRMLAADAYRYSGEAEKGQQLLDEIPALVQREPWRFSDRDSMLHIGKYALSIGEDARQVLDAFFDRSIRNDPRYVDAFVAISELALEKNDYQEALNNLNKAVELRSQDPYIHYLIAQAWAPSDGEKAQAALQKSLELNSGHTPSLLMHAENLTDGERYSAAEEQLESILAVNPSHPAAWALKAAIAHLQGNYELEGTYRKRALEHWATNPEVDYRIGKYLSQHYRFQDSVQYQRRALKFDPRFRQARFQLAQDLLRVGQDAEGWSIVDQVASGDKFNVVAFNLKTLQEKISKFATLEHSGFLIRMDAREADIYGPRVVKLLTEARKILTDKYGLELTKPVTVEIFPAQSDFAIRTFGLPGGAGFLGVCFGTLITANSPASQGESPANWESVLWHEFCHVVTLQKTNNRMPRWLSEGISVYEELQRNSSWGQRMSPLYKSMLLGEDFVPLSELSSAFLSPKSPMHLQFAYFESSLAVRYLIERHGLPLMKKLLDELGLGLPIAEAFARLYGDTKRLDEDFEAYVRQLAVEFYPETDFTREGLPNRPSSAELEGWLEDHPASYAAQLLKVQALIGSEDWSTARDEAAKLLSLFPEDSDPGGALDLCARISRELADESAEEEYLERLTDLSSDNVPAILRLISIARARSDWTQVLRYSELLLAVQPLIPTGHEGLAEAGEQLEQPEKAIAGLRALQVLQPVDPAGVHFRLAGQLRKTNDLSEARMEALRALEQTPRYREAQKLLVQIRAELDRSTPRSTTMEMLVQPPDAGRAPIP